MLMWFGACRVMEFQTRFQTRKSLETVCALTYSDGGNIYGQIDIVCDTGDREVFEAVAKILPRDAVWVASSLQRTHQTAEAIWATGFPKPASMAREAAFAEQNLGQ